MKKLLTAFCLLCALILVLGLSIAEDAEDHWEWCWNGNSFRSLFSGSTISIPYNGEQAEIYARYDEEPATVTISPRGAVDPGSYSVTATYNGITDSHPLEIVKYQVKSVTWSNTSLTYNGKEQTPVATYKNYDGTKVACIVTVKDGPAVDASDYTAVASLPEWSNEYCDFDISAVTEKAFSIQPAKTSIIWVNGTLNKEYKGYEQTPSAYYQDVNGKAVFVNFDFTPSSSAIDVGEYTAFAKMEDPNYEISNSPSTKFTIYPYTVTPILSQSSFVYDCKTHTPEIYFLDINDAKKLIDDVTVLNNSPNCGKYTVSISLPDEYKKNFKLSAESLQFEVTKLLVSPVVEQSSFTYDGEIHVPRVYFIGADDAKLSVDATVNNNSADVGTYTLSLSLNDVLGMNYTLTASKLSFKIEPLEVTVSPVAASKQKGEPDPELTYTAESASPFSGGDLVTVLKGKGLSVTRKSGEASGLYAFVFSGFASKNFVVTIHNDKKFEIIKDERPANVVVSGAIIEGSTDVSGYASAGNPVTVSVNNESSTVIADKNGRFSTEVSPLEAGDHVEIRVKESDGDSYTVNINVAGAKDADGNPVNILMSACAQGREYSYIYGNKGFYAMISEFTLPGEEITLPLLADNAYEIGTVTITPAEGGFLADYELTVQCDVTDAAVYVYASEPTLGKLMNSPAAPNAFCEFIPAEDTVYLMLQVNVSIPADVLASLKPYKG